MAGSDSGEWNSAYLNNLLNELRRSNDERIFVIAQLGREELARRLNHARLDDDRLYLIESGPTQRERVVFAEGEHVSVEGRVEFYRGELKGEVAGESAGNVAANKSLKLTRRQQSCHLL